MPRRTSSSMTATVAPAPQRHLTELTLEFLATLELERGLSRNTLEAYRSDLQQYGAFLGRVAIDPLAGQARRPARVHLRARAPGAIGKRPSARPRCSARSPACARSTATCVASRSSTTTRPPSCAPPRSPERLPKVLSRDEVNRLLAQPQGTSAAALRDRALLETMYACGLRASEAVSLELSDLDLEAGAPAGARQGLQGADSCRSAARRSRR